MSELRDFVERLIIYRENGRARVVDGFPKVILIPRFIIDQAPDIQACAEHLHFWLENAWATYRIIEETSRELLCVRIASGGRA